MSNGRSIVLDAHTHMGPGLRNHSYELPLDLVEAESLVAVMDEAGIDRAVTFAPLLEGGEFEDPLYERANRVVHEATRRFPGRIIGYCRVNPNFGQQALDEMKRCREEYGLRGLKLHPDWEFFYANSRVVNPLMERCAEYGWPVFFHTGYYPLSHPALFLPVAKAFPTVPIIMAHLGYRHTADCIVVAHRCPNVYLETSGNSSQVAIQETLKQVGPDRLLFGSDVPYTLAEDVMQKIRTLPGLTKENEARIMGGNMARILGMS
ncbi:MAG: amidohydrolase [Armatimonadetes bacterium]|nr:amidohydrolase [Armatimonadota bacterium]